MSSTANIGFHAVWIQNDDGSAERSGAGNAIVGAFLNRLGLHERVVEFVTLAKPGELLRMTKLRADNLGLAVELVDQLAEARELHNLAIRRRWAEKPDLVGAAEAYRAAAEAGYAGSQNNLGDMYEDGEGVPQSTKLAIYWFTRAAERGEPTAYLSLSTFLSKDTDDPVVLIEALKFAKLATKSLPKGKNMQTAVATVEAVSKRLSKEQRDKAEHLAREWTPLHQEKYLMSDTPR